jgi:alpha-tubulin suppressor-like RCC1 family protein
MRKNLSFFVIAALLFSTSCELSKFKADDSDEYGDTEVLISDSEDDTSQDDNQDALDEEFDEEIYDESDEKIDEAIDEEIKEELDDESDDHVNDDFQDDNELDDDSYYALCGNGMIDIGEECDGNTISCSILNLGETGKAVCNDTCTGFITADKCFRIFACDKNPVNSSWNSVSEYEQTWDGEKWTPSSSSTQYNTEQDNESCRYKCNDGYEHENGECNLILDPCLNDPCSTVDYSDKICSPGKFSNDLFTGEYSCGCDEGYVWAENRCNAEWDKVAVGYSHSCGISKGSLYCWGHNSYGVLGITTDSIYSNPQPVLVDDGGWSDISTYKSHACGIKDGEMYCWGQNEDNHLGLGSSNIYVPTKVGDIDTWETVSTSENHTCGIADGSVYCWGNNESGQLGNTSYSDSTVPVLADNTKNWNFITTYGNSTCGIADGELYCWGKNISGQLLDGSIVSKPFPVKIGTRTDWSSVEISSFDICGIADGELFCWAWWDQPYDKTKVEPEKASSDSGWEEIKRSETEYTHDNFSCGIINGSLFCWGNNRYGILANDTIVFSPNPVKVGNYSDWQEISAGYMHSCALRNKVLYCWGHNSGGRLGNGVVINSKTPQAVYGNRAFDKYSGGSSHFCATSEGNLYCWGYNSKGHFGYSGFIAHKIPFLIDNSGLWTHVEASYARTCGIYSGKIYCWGNNSELFSWNVCESLSDWGAVSLGEDATNNDILLCSIRNNDLYCLGKNQYGQVGDGTILDREEMTKISDNLNWDQVSVGIYGNYTCGIAEGELYCWGQNNAGQLGTGSTTNIQSPVKITENTNWLQVSTGNNHTCGIAGGELFCWGSNSGGKIGDGTTISRYLPTKIGDKNTWEFVHTTNSLTCAISSGELYCWGASSYIITKKTPQRIGDSTGWTSLSGDGTSVCGKLNENLYCLGDNTSGQLGNNISWEETPTLVENPVYTEE